jgi:hypothetical protein
MSAWVKMAGLSAAVVVAVVLAIFLIVCGWYIVWRIFLSKLPFFRALFGYPDETSTKMKYRSSGRLRKSQKPSPNQSLSTTQRRTAGTSDSRREEDPKEEDLDTT